MPAGDEARVGVFLRTLDVAGWPWSEKVFPHVSIQYLRNQVWTHTIVTILG
jgi:hypothetical protein